MAKETAKFQATFHQQQIKANGAVVLIFRAPFVEVANTVKTVMAVQRAIEVTVKDEDGTIHEVCDAGSLHNLKIDRDGESVIMIMTDLSDLDVSSQDLQSFVGTSIEVRFEWQDEA